jgi:hypothetical protein
VALLAHGSIGKGVSSDRLSFASKAGELLTVEQVNTLIKDGISKPFASSSLNHLVGVEDNLWKAQFPTLAKQKQTGPIIVNTSLYIGQDIARRIPLWVFRDGPNNAEGKPPSPRSWISLRDLLTSKGQQSLGLPANGKLLILCCRMEDVSSTSTNP